MSDAGTVDLDASGFADRIGTNYSATDDEVKELTELLAAPTAELDALQEEMDRLSDRLDKLYHKRKALAGKVDAHRALMSPIRRMPVDIIQEIFLLCLPTKNNPVMSRHHCPMLLTQVCSSWRRVAHSTPLLWSAIHIVIPCQTSAPHYYPPTPPWNQAPSQSYSPHEVAHKRAAGIQQWFTRAAACPLDIVIYDRDRGLSDSAYEIILTAIIAFSRQWEAVRFQSSSHCLERVVALSKHDVPMLKSLNIRGRDAPDAYTPGNQDSDFLDFRFLQGGGILNAPQLRQIEYSRVTEDFLQFSLNWEQLTSISLSGVSWTMTDYLSLTRIVRILKRCPALVRGTFEVSASTQHDDFVGPNSHLSIRHLSLEFLSLQICRHDLAVLLPILDTPALRELELFIGGPQSSSSTPEDVTSFLKRVSPTLQALTMDSFLFSKESLHRCLRLVPGLRSLALRPSHFPGHDVWTPPPQHIDLDEDQRPVHAVDNDLLKAFTDDLDPLLEMLESFECNADTSMTDEALLSFIRTKRSPTAHARLKKVAVVLKRAQTLPMVAELRQYVKDGLDCQLSYIPTFTQGPYSASDGIFSHGPYRPWGVLSFDDNDTVILGD